MREPEERTQRPAGIPDVSPDRPNIGMPEGRVNEYGVHRIQLSAPLRGR